MKWFGRKGATSESRPPLARAWSGLGWMAIGSWDQSYDAQLRAAVLANPVAQRALRLVSEAAGSAALIAMAQEPGVATQALQMVQRRSAGQSLIETLAAHILLHGNGYVQIGHGPDGQPPGAGAAVTAGFVFDVPVRFAEDSLEIDRETFAAGMVPSVPLLEIRQ